MALALKYYAKVKRGGRVDIPKVPLKPGTMLEVILLETNGEIQDLTIASETSTDFWNNSIDEEIWNQA